jgi:Multicopper oxidase
MFDRQLVCRSLALVLMLCALQAHAQSFMVQCPNSTLWHPGNAYSGLAGYAANPNDSVAAEPAYTGPQTYSPATSLTNGVALNYTLNGGSIKCQQISGGDGYMTEADGNQTFMFSFGPLSGLQKIRTGQAGTDYPDEFDQPYCEPVTNVASEPWTQGIYNDSQPNPYTNGGTNPIFPLNKVPCSPNGAVGYQPPAGYVPAVGQVILTGNALTSTTPTGIFVVDISNAVDFPGVTHGAGYSSPPQVTFAPPTPPFGSCTLPLNGTTCVQATGTATIGHGSIIEIAITNPGAGYTNAGTAGVAPLLVSFTPTSPPSQIAGTDPAAIMNTGVMNGNIPAPEIAIDEDDEFFLTLTNVGMIMRPDLFETHTVHFHGYPNASSYYDGVPDASISINIGASFTYYYLAPDAGTYFWHCHITPPEHLEMGMVGQLYVRPRQNRVPGGTNLYNAMTGTNTGGAFGTPTGPSQQSDLRTACYSGGESNLYAGSSAGPTADILCSVPSPAADTLTTHVAGWKYVYNDGDGSTHYDVDVPIQMHGFDPNFHFVGMTFNPEGFADMKDKYFLLNGRSYPDTVGIANSSVNAAAGWSGGVADATSNPDVGSAGAYGSNSILTAGSDGQMRPEQPIATLIVLSQSGGKDGTGAATPQIAALRLVNLSVSEYHTLASLSIPMHVVGWNAKMLRDQAGNDLGYWTNSITLGGGESLDALLDACAVRQGPPSYTCTAMVPVGTYFLYTPNLDHLANDAENFGGMMTEVVVTP